MKFTLKKHWRTRLRNISRHIKVSWKFSVNFFAAFPDQDDEPFTRCTFFGHRSVPNCLALISSFLVCNFFYHFAAYRPVGISPYQFFANFDADDRRASTKNTKRVHSVRSLKSNRLSNRCHGKTTLKWHSNRQPSIWCIVSPNCPAIQPYLITLAVFIALPTRLERERKGINVTKLDLFWSLFHTLHLNRSNKF